MKIAIPAYALLTIFFFQSSLYACSVCYGNPDSPLTRGLNLAMMFLMAVIGSLLSLFAVYFIFVARRSVMIRKHIPKRDPIHG